MPAGRNIRGDALNAKTDEFGEVMVEMPSGGSCFGEVSTSVRGVPAVRNIRGDTWNAKTDKFGEVAVEMSTEG